MTGSFCHASIHGWQWLAQSCVRLSAREGGLVDLNARCDVSSREQGFVERVLHKTCRGIQVQQVIYEGGISDPCNVVFMELSDAPTLRFFFDGGVFFWREEEPAPIPASVGFRYRLLRPEAFRVLEQKRVLTAAFSLLPRQRRVLELRFETGVALYLQNADDKNTVVIG